MVTAITHWSIGHSEGSGRPMEASSGDTAAEGTPAEHTVSPQQWKKVLSERCFQKWTHGAARGGEREVAPVTGTGAQLATGPVLSQQDMLMPVSA